MSYNPLLKGTLQTIILKLLEGGDRMYGYEISQKVKEVTAGGIVLTEPALYSALHKLEADGLLEAVNDTVGNRVRKYYSLTENGSKEAAVKVQDARIFLEQLTLLLNLKPDMI